MNSLAALADPTRRRIVEALARGPLASGEIAGRFAVSAPAISQHLKTLRAAKLVRVRREAQRRIYELDKEGIDALAVWVDELRQFWSTRFDALDAALRKPVSPAAPAKSGKRLLPGPMDRVWAHLTDTKLLPAWFGKDSHIEPRQGGEVRLSGGHIRGTVTQWQPPHKLIYTWNVFKDGDGPEAVSAYPESYPTFELAACGKDVVLSFTHFPILDRFIPQNAMGWHTMLDMLEATLRGEKVEDRAVYSRKNAAVYGVDLNKLAR